MTIPARTPAPGADGGQAFGTLDEAAAFVESEREPDQEPGDGASDEEALDAFVEDDPDVELIDPNAETEDVEEEGEGEEEGDEEDAAGTLEEDADEADDEGGSAKQGRQKPSRTARLQKKIAAKDAELELFRTRDFEWAKVSNAMKLQRDFWKQEAEAAQARLGELGEADESETRMRLAKAELELRERDFDREMDQRQAQIRSAHHTALQRERAVDRAISAADKLSTKHGVDRDYLLFKWSENPNQNMEDVARGMAGKAKVKASEGTKKQITKNRKAPRKPPKGRSARPTRRPRVGDSESFVDAGVADIMKWREG